MYNYIKDTKEKIKSGMSKLEILIDLEKAKEKEIDERNENLSSAIYTHSGMVEPQSQPFVDTRSKELEEIEEALKIVKNLPVITGEITKEKIQDAIDKNPYNIFFIEDKIFSSKNFDYAFEMLPKTKLLTEEEILKLKKDLKNAIKSNNKEKAKKIIDSCAKSLDEIIMENKTEAKEARQNNEDISR